jgi:Fic family protein
MTTLRQFAQGLETIPASTSWYLADLGEAKGKEALFTRQSPQRLKALREHALIESAVSSNRIEGVEVDRKRVGTIIFGKPILQDRNEEEVAGYRAALKWIHEQSGKIPLDLKTIKELHRNARGGIGDAGLFKTRDSDIIEKFAGGGSRIRFKTVPASQTPAAMKELTALWAEVQKARLAHPLVAMAAFNLDFLCIHPFRDGNGRVSRLLLLLQSYQLGYGVGRFISLERLIEQNKERYYETLEQSSRGWHQSKHDPWPYINYVLFIFKAAYKEFEGRVGNIASARGAKTELVLEAIKAISGAFSLSELETACPGVSHDMIRRVLRDLQKNGQVECLGRGPGALWQKKVNTPKKR